MSSVRKVTMQQENPNVYIPQQFSNPNNPQAHKYYTALEILEQVAGPIDLSLIHILESL